MAKQINVNVSGDPKGDIPFIMDDSSPAKTVDGKFENPGRVIFKLPDDMNGGAYLVWTVGTARFLLPPAGWVGEGTSLGLPDISYESDMLGWWTVSGSRFMLGTTPIYWKGVTHFRLLEMVLEGQDISTYLTQIKELGFNVVRVVGMKENNTGWRLDPRRGDYWGGVNTLFKSLESFRLQCEFTVFADTKTMMPNQNEQLGFWTKVIDTTESHDNVMLELLNEYGHPTQSINPLVFPRPQGILASHGSGLTDCDGVQPYWDYMTYHARRDGAKGFTNYDQYEFQSVYPSIPRIPDEGVKPEDYGHSTEFAALLGKHAACGAGGTFHWGGGVNGDMMDSRTYDCAMAFTDGLA